MNRINLLDGLFTAVRDIPFKIVFQPKDMAVQIAHLLEHNSGGCTAKHCLLGRIFKSLGLEVLYLDFPFYWHEQAYLPEQLRLMAEGLPLTSHLALEVMIDGTKFFVDASWDKGLAKALPVSDPPFGTGFACSNAVWPCGEAKLYSDPAERQAIVEDAEYQASADKKRPFYLAINEYLRQVRSSTMEAIITR